MAEVAEILTGRFFLSMPPAPTLAAALCRPLEAMTAHLESSPTCRALCPALLLCSSQASVQRLDVLVELLLQVVPQQ